MQTRKVTDLVNVGNVKLGASLPIVIQSMVACSTLNVDGCVEESIKIIEAGGEMVRFTAASVAEANAIELIKQKLVEKGYNTPLVADVHFNPKAAMVAAKYADKVRINPGNFIDPRAKFETFDYTDTQYNEELKRLETKFLEFLNICEEHNTAIRIGVNHGSLSDRIMSRYGDTINGMCESAMEFLRICKKEKFPNVVVSMKSSNVVVMTEAYRQISHKLSEENMSYPLHLGVTEAGEGEDGRVKSSLGIGTLLSEGIGDTIRVSLTEPSWHEIKVAKSIIDYVPTSFIGDLKHPIKQRTNTTQVVFHNDIESSEIYADAKTLDGKIIENINYLESLSLEKSEIIIFAPKAENTALELIYFFEKYKQLELNNKVAVKKTYNESNPLMLTIKMAMDFGRTLLSGYGDYLMIENDNIAIKPDKVLSVIFSLLQATRVRISRTEFISCPGCGRTQFALVDAVQKVKEKCAKFKGLKIAIMGCNVNGPGEMADADFGYVGAGKGKVILYKGKEAVTRTIEESVAVDKLVELIEQTVK